MQHDYIVDGEDSVLSGGSSILIDGGLPAERFSNSIASWERREDRQQQRRRRRQRPGQQTFARGQARASTAPEYNDPEDVPAYSVFLPTIGVEVTASGGRFSVTQRRSPDRRVWRERKSTQPRTTIGPMLSEPSVEDMDGFDKDYGDRPTPIITASPQKIIRVRPLDIEPVGQRTVRGGDDGRRDQVDGGGGGGGGVSGHVASTLADYFEQQVPRKEDVVWAGDGGNYPGAGVGRSVAPNIRNAPYTAPSKAKRKRGGGSGSGGGPMLEDEDRFTTEQRQSPYWAPKPMVPKYAAARLKTAEPGMRPRTAAEEQEELDDRRQYLTTPNLSKFFFLFFVLCWNKECEKRGGTSTMEVMGEVVFLWQSHAKHVLA